MTIRPGIYAILDLGSYDELLALGERLLTLNLGALQIRAKSLAAAERQELARVLKKRHEQERAPFPFIVNDDLALAKELGCGLHLGQSDGPAAAARETLGASALLGRSTHDLHQVEKAAKERVDYLGYGPIFATSSKKDALQPRGVGELMAAQKSTDLPLVAIGGLTFENVTPLLEAGIRRFAMLSALHNAAFEPRLNQFQARLKRWL